MTRDSVEVPCSYHFFKTNIVDTAGTRRYSKTNHDDKIKNLSELDALRAINAWIVDMSEPKMINISMNIAWRVIQRSMRRR